MQQRCNFNAYMTQISKIFPHALTVVIAVFIAYLSSKFIIPIEPGDSISHYYYSLNAFSEPLNYLHHWAKPLFTLVTSPFAQFGLQGVIYFNVFLFVASSYFGIKILQKLHVSVLVQMMFPILLVQTPDFLFTTLAGLTEPLFAFLVIFSTYLLLNKKYFWYAIIVSLLPYARSEGQYVVVLAFGALLYFKAYKHIPLLAFGFLVYGVIGHFALNDFLWYFHDNPYTGESVYGHGDWGHFFRHSKQIIGVLGYIVLALAIFGLSVIFIQAQERAKNWFFIVYGSAIFGGIAFVHAYLWVQGTNGSAGLTRVMQQGVPIFFVVLLYLVDALKFHNNRVQRFILIIPTVAVLVSFFGNNTYSKSDISGIDEAMITSSKYIKAHRKEEQTIYYFHPLLAYLCNSESQANKGKYIQRYFKNIPEDISYMQAGDWIIRDSHFGPVEQGLPYGVLDTMHQVKLVHVVVPNRSGESVHGEAFGARIYEVVSSK